MSSSGNFSQDTKHLWQDAGMAERYANAENATRPSCQLLVAKSGLADLTDDVKVFDLATGTGAAVQEIYDAVPKEKWGKVSILGGDVSEPMLAYLKARGEREGWTGLETKQLDGNVSLTIFTFIWVVNGLEQAHYSLPVSFQHDI